MKKIIYSFATLIAIALLNACYYDKADLLYGTKNGNCADTVAVISYSAKVVPLLNTQCYSCHISGQGGITMGNYTTDKAIATNGRLYGSISSGSMPKGGPKMDICDINLIKKWIDAGSPNN
jgi:hypothetical protein